MQHQLNFVISSPLSLNLDQSVFDLGLESLLAFSGVPYLPGDYLFRILRNDLSALFQRKRLDNLMALR
jgi:hypothetical protein